VCPIDRHHGTARAAKGTDVPSLPTAASSIQATFESAGGRRIVCDDRQPICRDGKSLPERQFSTRAARSSLTEEWVDRADGIGVSDRLIAGAWFQDSRGKRCAVSLPERRRGRVPPPYKGNWARPGRISSVGGTPIPSRTVEPNSPVRLERAALVENCLSGRLFRPGK